MILRGEKRAGLVLSTASGAGEARPSAWVGGPRVFVDAREARAVVELGARTLVAQALGVGVGVAAVGSQLVTLLDLDVGGDADRPRVGVLAEIESGESVLLVGGPVLATGLFDRASEGDGIVFEGSDVRPLSIALVYRKVEARVWETRALASQGRPPASRRSEGRTP